MKQCPQCRQHFGDEQKFCDSDGTPLLDETVLSNALGALEPAAPIDSQSRQMWPIVTIGILIGVIISLGAYVLMVMPRAEKDVLKSGKAESARLNTSETTAQ